MISLTCSTILPEEAEINSSWLSKDDFKLSSKTARRSAILEKIALLAETLFSSICETIVLNPATLSKTSAKLFSHKPAIAVCVSFNLVSRASALEVKSFKVLVTLTSKS